ncbi:unannotated protein [freshwater metagenome]|uniref:Unannotated protein n=1 Tax=freshwater metagenome TaxID=449393 RepID=A0A6J7R6W4_9ZZZZ
MLAKVRAGNCSASRKSALVRWPSRSALPVLMLAAWMVSVVDELAGVAPSRASEPSNSAKRPCTLAIMA